MTFEGPAGTCDRIHARATVGGSLTTFAQIDGLEIEPGVIIIIDIGGPTISVDFPEPGICFDGDEITVTGTATDDIGVTSVTVNGVQAILTPTTNPGEVTFEATIALPVKGPNEINIVATDTSDKIGQVTFTIFNDAGPPDVSFAPANGTVTSLLSLDVEGSATDDAGIASVAIFVNGLAPIVLDGAAALNLPFDETVALNLGLNTITVVATDISEKSTTILHEVTVVENQPPAATLIGPLSVTEGQSPAYTFAVSDVDDTAFTVKSAGCGANGAIGTVNSDGMIPGDGGFTCAFADGPAASTVSVQVTDAFGFDSNVASLSVDVLNVAPTVSFNLSANPVNENDSVQVTGTVVDPGAFDSQTVFVDWGDSSTPTVLSLDPGVTSFMANHPYPEDDPTNTSSDPYPINVTATDKDSGFDQAGVTLTVNNVDPVITGITAPFDPVPLGQQVGVTADFTDVGTQDTHTCSIDWDDPDPANPDGNPTVGVVTETSGSGSCEGTRTFGGPGVYRVEVTVTDDDTGATTSAFEFIVVFDPDDGFVTGGGFINSPPGGYTPDNPNDEDFTGKANFGFVSRYKGGANVPTGETEFQFKVADLNFHSRSYDWLVVAGPKAQFKGDGTVNGLFGSNGVNGYGFLLTATDGQQPGGGGDDKFRIKIVDKDTDTLLYDNGAGSSDDIDEANPQIIGGGSIVIHKKGSSEKTETIVP